MYQSTEQLAANSQYYNFTCDSVETLLEKGSGKLNEDVLLRENNIFGVFDGATSLDTTVFEKGLTGGRLAAELAAEAFRQGGNLRQCTENANRSIRQARRRYKVPPGDRHTLWSTSAAVIRLHRDCLEFCQTGDSLILLLQQNGGHRLLTPETDHDRETLSMWKKITAPPHLTIQEALKDQIIKVRREMNISYGVLNGEQETMNFLNHGRVGLDGISDILLFTDGLFLPRSMPWEENDWAAFTLLYREGGLKKLKNYIRKIEIQDPGCRLYPRFKTHDDIAAIAISLNS